MWGLLNGFYQVVGDALAPVRERVLGALRISGEGLVRRCAQTAWTFALITTTWVFFRAASLSDALYILRRIAATDASAFANRSSLDLVLPGPQMAVAAVAVLTVLAVEGVSVRVDLHGWLSRQPVAVRWAAYQLMVLAVAVFGYYGPTYRAADFAYFKF